MSLMGTDPGPCVMCGKVSGTVFCKFRFHPGGWMCASCRNDVIINNIPDPIPDTHASLIFPCEICPIKRNKFLVWIGVGRYVRIVCIRCAKGLTQYKDFKFPDDPNDYGDL